MDEWEKFNEISSPVKEEFYSNLNMKRITDADYMHAKIVCKDFEIRNVGEYHDLYLKSDTLTLANVFEKNVFGNLQLDPAKFLSATRLPWKAALKRPKQNIDVQPLINGWKRK